MKYIFSIIAVSVLVGCTIHKPIDEVHTTVKEVQETAEKVVETTKETIEEVKEIAENVEEKIDDAKEVIETVQEKVETVKEVVQTLSSEEAEIVAPINDIVDSLIGNTTTEEVVEEVQVGTYITYSPSVLDTISGKFVLYFGAKWCPTCIRFEKDVTENLSDIPADVTIVRVDYDSHKDLRKLYGVTSQHTFIQLNEKGQLVHRWLGSSTLSSFLKKLK